MKLTRVALVLAASVFGCSVSHAAVILTDAAVFSTNGSGENWNGWIWNTRGADTDPENRWNLYYSNSPNAADPSFINSGNAAGTGISIDLAPGTHSFLDLRRIRFDHR